MKRWLSRNRSIAFRNAASCFVCSSCTKAWSWDSNPRSARRQWIRPCREYAAAARSLKRPSPQLLVLLGTLMTAITSFYLGAGTAISSAAASQTAASPSPTVSSIKPTSHSIDSDGELINLEVLGAAQLKQADQRSKQALEGDDA